VESAILFLSPLIAWLVDEGACTMKSISDIAGRWAPRIITGFTAAVFLDSLRFKFTDHPNTQEIFGRLDAWATSLGAPGLFDVTGLFSQYVIGTGELVASSLLIAGMLLPSYRFLQAVGAAIGVAIMSGAISFQGSLRHCQGQTALRRRAGAFSLGK
jgi:hypothetical protein